MSSSGGKRLNFNKTPAESKVLHMNMDFFPINWNRYHSLPTMEVTPGVYGTVQSAIEGASIPYTQCSWKSSDTSDISDG